MALHSQHVETVDFDDPALTASLFGPQNLHLDLLAEASGTRIGSRGSHLWVESADEQARQRVCNVLIQLYALLREGMAISRQDVVRSYAMLDSDPGLDLRQVFREAVFVNTPPQERRGAQCGAEALS